VDKGPDQAVALGGLAGGEDILEAGEELLDLLGGGREVG
jgi:hypothetical protein